MSHCNTKTVKVSELLSMKSELHLTDEPGDAPPTKLVYVDGDGKWIEKHRAGPIVELTRIELAPRTFNVIVECK